MLFFFFFSLCHYSIWEFQFLSTHSNLCQAAVTGRWLIWTQTFCSFIHRQGYKPVSRTAFTGETEWHQLKNNKRGDKCLDEIFFHILHVSKKDFKSQIWKEWKTTAALHSSHTINLQLQITCWVCHHFRISWIQVPLQF